MIKEPLQETPPEMMSNSLFNKDFILLAVIIAFAMTGLTLSMTQFS